MLCDKLSCKENIWNSISYINVQYKSCSFLTHMNFEMHLEWFVIYIFSYINCKSLLPAWKNFCLLFSQVLQNWHCYRVLDTISPAQLRCSCSLYFSPGITRLKVTPTYYCLKLMNITLSVQLLTSPVHGIPRYIMHLFCLSTALKLILHLHSSKLPLS